MNIVPNYVFIKIVVMLQTRSHSATYMRQMYRLFEHEHRVLVICCIHPFYLLFVAYCVNHMPRGFFFFWGRVGWMSWWWKPIEAHTLLYASVLIHAYTAHEYNYQPLDGIIPGINELLYFGWISPALHVIPQMNEWTVEHSERNLIIPPSIFPGYTEKKLRAYDFEVNLFNTIFCITYSKLV